MTDIRRTNVASANMGQSQTGNIGSGLNIAGAQQARRMIPTAPPMNIRLPRPNPELQMQSSPLSDALREPPLNQQIRLENTLENIRNEKTQVILKKRDARIGMALAALEMGVGAFTYKAFKYLEDPSVTGTGGGLLAHGAYELFNQSSKLLRAGIEHTQLNARTQQIQQATEDNKSTPAAIQAAHIAQARQNSGVDRENHQAQHDILDRKRAELVYKLEEAVENIDAATEALNSAQNELREFRRNAVHDPEREQQLIDNHIDALERKAQLTDVLDLFNIARGE